MRTLLITIALALAAAGISGCTERGKELTWGTAARIVSEGCQAGTSPLAIEGRKEAVAEINQRTTTGNYTASDCDEDGEPDFDINPDGTVVTGP